jgi:hypothetical protein
MTRQEWLAALIDLSKPIQEALTELNEFGWDSDRPLVTIRRQHILSVLGKYFEGSLQAEDVETWADSLHVREDVDFEIDFEELVREALFELGNPYLTQSLDPGRAKRWIERLS